MDPRIVCIKAHGFPGAVPLMTDKRISVRLPLPAAQHKAMKIEAARQGVTLRSLILSYLSDVQAEELEPTAAPLGCSPGPTKPDRKGVQ